MMTYKAVGRSIINYAAPVCGVQTYTTPTTQNEALRIATGCQKMSSIDHLHTEAEMLKVWEQSELLSAQYLVMMAIHTLNNTVANVFNQLAHPCANNHCNTRYEQSFRHNKHTHTDQKPVKGQYSMHNPLVYR